MWTASRCSNAARLLIAGCLALCCAADARAQAERQRAEALARRATERIRALQREAEELASRERTILGELRRLEIDRQLKVEEVRRLDAELTATRADLAALDRDVARLEQQVVAATPGVSARLASLYKMGRPGYWRLLLDVEDVRSVGRAYRTVAAMARIDRDRIQEHQRRLEALRGTRDRARRRAEEVARLQGRARAARAALDRAIEARNARVQAIDRERDLNAQLTGELQDAQRRLQASLAELAAGRTPPPVTLPLGAFRRELPWPIRGPVIAPFGRQPSSRFGTSIVRNGVEIEGREGEPVAAIHEGRVAFAGAFMGFGNLVIVEHGRDSYSLYGHLDGLDVEKGEMVERQSQIGTVGRTPRGTAALYFELRVDGRPVNPLQWLKR